jgi:probable FeS assembly SUF system protein SufT
MFHDQNEYITLERDVPATQIPMGTKVTLKEGDRGQITQALGGSYTLLLHGNLFRIDGKDADAIGKSVEVEADAESESSNGEVNEEAVWDVMKSCYDPEIPVNIVELGLIYTCEFSEMEESGTKVDVKMTLTAPGCGMGQILSEEVKQKIMGISGVSDVQVELVWDPPWDQGMMSESARLHLGLL